jgi:hypothetical protein
MKKLLIVFSVILAIGLLNIRLADKSNKAKVSHIISLNKALANGEGDYPCPTDPSSPPDPDNPPDPTAPKDPGPNFPPVLPYCDNFIPDMNNFYPSNPLIVYQEFSYS